MLLKMEIHYILTLFILRIRGNKIVAEGIANWILSDKYIFVIKYLNNRPLKFSRNYQN